MGPAGLLALLLCSLAGFGWLAWRKLAIVAVLQPQPRWDHPGQRLKSVLVNGFLQRRMVQRDWKPGLMHAVIFLGFLSLLVRKLQLLAIGFDAGFVFPAAFGGPFAAFKDGVELAVAVAVLLAMWRRAVTRPARLEPNREAWLVLGLILLIMATDLGFDAFRFALRAGADAGIAHERAWAWLGSALSVPLQGWPRATLQAGEAAFYWVQMATVLSFLVLLPAGEHFHIVTALPTLFMRRGTPANAVPAVDVDALMNATDEADMHAGVRSAADLGWKEGLDVFTCTECGRCKDACPTHLTGKPLSMKAVNDSLKHHLLDQRATLLHGDRTMLPPLLGGVIADETLWACTTCGACEAACPIELEHLPRFLRMRQHQVMIEGEFPQAFKKVFEAYESQGNPWGLQAAQRGDWAAGLQVPLVHSASDMAGLDWLFYVGSAMSFDPRGQKIARAFVAVLQAAGVRFGILGADEGSTGECVRRCGNELLYQQLTQQLVATLNERGVRRIVTCDPHAFNSLRNEAPAFGGVYEVQHHSQVLATLLREGRLPLQPAALQRVVFHDPCYLGRHNGEFDAPRAVLKRLCSDAPLEMALSGEQAMCCGAGGGRMWLEETLGTRINVLRVQQAQQVQPQTIATACPYCAVMLGDGLGGLADQAGAAPVRQRDLAELVAEALLPAPAAATAVAELENTP
jgi:Fe-S oxidoreductase